MTKPQDALVTEITPQSEDFSRWYLDVVRRVQDAYGVPNFLYQERGEYEMV